MGGQNCPKCGSDQVANDQCFKCGIVISKFYNAAQTSVAPVSFVATSHSHKEYSYSVSEAHVEYQERRVKDKWQRFFLGIGILVILGLIVFGIWHLLSERAAEYSGIYKNGKLIYGLWFPPGPKWFHGRATNLESLGIKDPQDAFYRGEDRDNPEVSIAVYVEDGENVPEKIDARLGADLLADAEESLLNRMSAHGVRCEIVDSYLHGVGGRDGFLIEAEIDKEGKIYQVNVLNGYYYGRVYRVYFIGLEEHMSESENIQRIMNSFSFKASAI